MNRRLNPELFNPHQSPSDNQAPQSSVVLTRQLEQELKETKKRVSHLESLLEVVQSQLKSLHTHSEKRTEGFAKAISSLEKEIRDQNLASNRRMEQLLSRQKDQLVVEGQMESMVDRFNTNIMQFENKIATLQKVISEKDMTLMSYRNILEQIVDEVEKLKNRNRPDRTI